MDVCTTTSTATKPPSSVSPPADAKEDNAPTAAAANASPAVTLDDHALAPDTAAPVDDKEFSFISVIRNYLGIETQKIYSPFHSFGGFKWRLLIFPRGNQTRDDLSVYLECGGPIIPDASDKRVSDAAAHVLSRHSPANSWSRPAHFYLQLVHPSRWADVGVDLDELYGFDLDELYRKPSDPHDPEPVTTTAAPAATTAAPAATTAAPAATTAAPAATTAAPAATTAAPAATTAAPAATTTATTEPAAVAATDDAPVANTGDPGTQPTDHVPIVSKGQRQNTMYNDIVKDTFHVFRDREIDWGFYEFAPFSNLRPGLHSDDEYNLVIKVRIRLDDMYDAYQTVNYDSR